MNNSLILADITNILEKANIQLSAFTIEQNGRHIEIKITGDTKCQMKDFYLENIVDKR